VFYVDLGGVNTNRAVYRGWIDHAAPARTPGQILVGDRVRSSMYGDGTVCDPSEGRHNQSRVMRAGEYAVRIDGSTTGGYFGGGVYLLETQGLTVTEEIGTQPATSVEPVNPIESGTRVWVANYGQRAVVVEKPTTGYAARYTSDPEYVAVQLAGSTEPTVMTASQVSVLDLQDAATLTAEQQLLRLQTLLHRVASYEAVRRDWCSEVDIALSHLDLPDHLSKVDRDLGRGLRDNPQGLFTMVEVAPIVDEDDDEDTECDCGECSECDPRSDYGVSIAVEFDDDDGWSHSGLVSLRLEGSDSNPDFDDVVTDDMVRSAVNDQTSFSVPSYNSVSWSINDYELAD
jgi:hypothetical protein